MRISIVLLLVSGAVCAQSILRVASRSGPGTFDPHRSTNTALFLYHAQAFEGPLGMGLDEDGRIRLMPAVCAEPRISDDGLTVTLDVRGRARYHDDPCFPEGKGRAVEPWDVVYMFLRHADPATRSPYWPIFLAGRVVGLDAWRARTESEGVADYGRDAVEGLRIDGKSVVIRLTEPYPQLPALLTQPWAYLVPPEAIRRYGLSGFGERPIGCGAFRFVKKDPLGTVHYARHPGYHVPRTPGVDELRIEHVPGIADQTERFEKGDLHVVEVVADNDETFLGGSGRLKYGWRRKGVKLVSTSALMVSYVVMNVRHKILSDRRVRRAISLAIDRERTLRTIWAGRAVIANSPVPPAFPESREIDDRPFDLAGRDLERAKELLAEAGHPGGEGVPELVFDLPGGGTELNRKAARQIADDLAQIGIELQIREEPFARWLQRVKTGDLQLAWVSWFADYPDVENFLLLFRSAPTYEQSQYNYGRYENGEFDALYDRIASMYPSHARSKLVADAVQIVRNDAPWVFLAFPHSTFATHRDVEGFRPNLLDHSLRGVRLKKRKR